MGQTAPAPRSRAGSVMVGVVNFSAIGRRYLSLVDATPLSGIAPPQRARGH